MKHTSYLSMVPAIMVLLASCSSARQAAAPIPQRSEVLDTGYGKVVAKHNSYSISRLDVDDKVVYNNIFDYIRGRVPGVQVGYASAGGTPKVTIRGESSLNSGTDPLYVVDGSVVADISSLNPYDIASVNVLKDASTAIYGTRGANGVIVFTTKTAKEAAAAEAQARKEAKAAAKAEKAAAKASKK